MAKQPLKVKETYERNVYFVIIDKIFFDFSILVSGQEVRGFYSLLCGLPKKERKKLQAKICAQRLHTHGTPKVAWGDGRKQFPEQNLWEKKRSLVTVATLFCC